MGKHEGKIAVIVGVSSGKGLATAKLFVEESATFNMTAYRQDILTLVANV